MDTLAGAGANEAQALGGGFHALLEAGFRKALEREGFSKDKVDALCELLDMADTSPDDVLAAVRGRHE